jgi:hypothetical protein
MKRLFVCFLLLAACKKHSTAPDPRYTGHWTWAYSESGPNTLLPAPDTVTVLDINTEGTYQVLLNNSVVAQGSFTLSTTVTPGLDLLQLSNPTNQYDRLALTQNSGASLRDETQVVTTMGFSIDTLVLVQYPYGMDPVYNVFGR